MHIHMHSSQARTNFLAVVAVTFVQPFLPPAGAPICINTVLWNTIKLLFPQHAANAPESPADAILTPSAANRAAMVQVLAAVPNAIMRHAVNAPFNPPRYSTVY